MVYWPQILPSGKEMFMNHNVFERERPLAHTRFGTLRGVTYGGVNIFMGVQYAHAKRFQMPVEIEPWEGIRNAYHHGPIAMQAMETNPFAYYRGLHMLEKQSEDCQNLNIWAPKTLNGEKKQCLFLFTAAAFSQATHLRKFPSTALTWPTTAM